MDILIRLGMAIVIIFAGVFFYWIWTHMQLNLLRRRTNRTKGLGLDEFRVGVPAILYFTAPDCVPCKTVQTPVLETLRKQYGDRLQIIKVDASERSDLADHWGVLSAPTTFIIDTQGRPRHVNNGVASAAKLRRQLRELGGLAEEVDETLREKTPYRGKPYRVR